MTMFAAERKNQSMLASIKALAERIDILIAALEAIESGMLIDHMMCCDPHRVHNDVAGATARDEDLLRKAASICHKLPPNGMMSSNIAKEMESVSAVVLYMLYS
jgi:hypothetical protein